MSVQDDQDFETDEQEPVETPQELRAAAKAGKAAKVEAEAARRELAFTKAGIDTDSDRGQMFMDSYKGELDKDAIKTKFDSIFGTVEAPNDDQDEAERAAAEEELKRQTQDRRDLTSAGTEHTPPSEGSLIDAGYQRMQEALNDGRPMEIAFREALGGTLAAANQGDPRAVWTGWSDEELEGWS
jgi:hypothetical protein